MSRKGETLSQPLPDRKRKGPRGTHCETSSSTADFLPPMVFPDLSLTADNYENDESTTPNSNYDSTIMYADNQTILANDNGDSVVTFDAAYTPGDVGVITAAQAQPTQPGCLHKHMDHIVLRNDDFSSVVNLSGIDLSISDLKILWKGLKFTPVPSNLDRLSLRESIAEFERHLRLAEFFHDSDNSDFDPKQHKFREKSTWTPAANRDKFLDSYISVITSEIMSAPEQKVFNNLSVAERAALRELKSDNRIVIREADKGSAVVVMDRDRYMAEGYRQLNDTSVYKRVNAKTINEVEKRIYHLTNRLHKQNVLTDDMRRHAVRTDTTPARFYLLPKVHKKGVPGRPVISACGSATEGLSEIVDHFLQPYVPSIPSFIKDTNDFIQKIRSIGSVPPGALLVTIDVVALYPSIPHNDGLSALRKFLKDRILPDQIINGVADMAELVLKNNVFEFNSECFLQEAGTAIGTKMAPAYANIFMSIFEHLLLSGSPYKPELWLRFIDDIFSIWTHGEEKLKDFITYINSVNPNIQFTCEYSNVSVNFLDVLVSVDKNVILSTDLYTKPTDTHQYLLANSCHPNHIKKSIPYSQALRYLRICSDLETARRHCTELTNYLCKRGYSRRKVTNQVERAIADFTKPNPTTTVTSKPRNVYFTADFHPGLPDIKGILQKFMPILHQSERMKNAVPQAPTISFRQPPSLGRTLCRAKLRTMNENTTEPSRPCGKKRCKMCDILICSDTITITNSTTQRKQTFQCHNQNTNCDSTWIIYCIHCPICDKLYVGQSNNLRLRMNGHRSDFGLYRTGKSTKMDNKVLYDHLLDHGTDKFNVQILDSVTLESSASAQAHVLLNKKEREWIWKLNTVTPNGLNSDDGFFSQNKKARKN